MPNEWFESLKAGEPDAPLEIVVRFKDDLYRYAYGLLQEYLEDPQIAADEIAMTTLERACLHCQRGGFAHLQAEQELLDWLHQAGDTATDEYLAAVERRRGVLKAFSESRFDEIIDEAEINVSELADFIHDFPESFGDQTTKRVAELFLEQKGVSAIQTALALSGPSARRRIDTVEKAFDRAVFAKKT